MSRDPVPLEPTPLAERLALVALLGVLLGGFYLGWRAGWQPFAWR